MSPKAKRGRPLKGDTKMVPLTIRMQPSDMALLRQLAALWGVPLSEAINRCVAGMSKHLTPKAKALLAALDEFRVEARP